MPRDVMLVGSVPLKPASAVFDAVCNHGLAPLMHRIPDGEQAGWDSPFYALGRQPFFEFAGKKRMTLRASTFFATMEMPYVKLKDGIRPEDVEMSLGIADNVMKSYGEFRTAKAQGRIPEASRFCATFPGPGTCFAPVLLPSAQLFPIAERVYRKEIDKVLAAIPHEELAIQLDLAVETEGEEYLRRPQDYEMPIFEHFDWALEDTIGMVANVANHIPADVELGFHLCALYHIDESQGQDLNVHVDVANLLAQKIRRPIGYIHIPTVPTHDGQDFEKLKRLKLHSETKLFLGLIHAEDGQEGAVRRVRAAAKSCADFGVAAFCGLAQPSRKEFERPHTVGEIFDMHRHAAEAG